MKKAARILAVVVILLLVAAISLPFLIDANRFRPMLEAKLTQALGREVKIGDLKLSVFSGGVEASDLSIADDAAFSKTPFLRAESLKAGVEMMPLIFSRKLNITGIEIVKPQIEMIQSPSGAWNFSSLGAKSPAVTPAAPPEATPGSAIPDLSVALVDVSGGRLTLTRSVSKAKPIILDKVDIDVKEFSPASSFPFSMTAVVPGGGAIKLNGNAGPIDQGNTIFTPLSAKLSVTHLDLLASGVMDPSAGIAGIASIDGTAESSNGVAEVKGKLKGEQLKLAKGGTPAKTPLGVDFAIQHDLGKQSGNIQSVNIHLGGVGANLTGSYRLDTEPPTVHLKFSGSKMPVAEIAALLPALDVRLPTGAAIEEGTANVNLASEGPLDQLVTSGTVGLENTKLANYDLASKLQVLHELSGIKAQPHTQIQLFSTNVNNSPTGTALDNIQLVVPSIGQITGVGAVSPTHQLNFKMRLAGIENAGLVAGFAPKGGIPFTIQGTSEDPTFRPDVKGLATQGLKDLTKSKSAGDAASELLNGLFGGKKKQQ